MKAKPLTSREFGALLAALDYDLPAVAAVAVALSGGPDSLALAWLMHQWAGKRKERPALHLLSVDHGLRADSAAEADYVARVVAGWPDARHSVLTWKGRKPHTAIQERAREARYSLLEDYCERHAIPALCLAHHQEDQAETVLLRLAGGSGLVGLCGMRPVHRVKEEGLTILRPLLSVSKERLIATCKKHKLRYVRDPGNESDKFARVRLRKAWRILEREGLSAKRLARTAERLARADEALEKHEKDAFNRHIYIRDTKSIVYNFYGLMEEPREIIFRLLVDAIETLRPEARFLPRMEKLEDILSALLSPAPFRKRTLGGLMFERKDKAGHLSIALQPPAKRRKA